MLGLDFTVHNASNQAMERTQYFVLSFGSMRTLNFKVLGGSA
jgi:hypothetical protein